MDDLDRVFHRLVSNIRHRHSEYLTLPFTVQELYETLIPYRHHRRELGIETNQDYETAVSRLLAGERDYLLTDQAMRDRLRTELESGHGDSGAFREFATTKVSLAPEALRRIRALTAAATDADAPSPAELSSPDASPPRSPAPVNATFPVTSPPRASAAAPPPEVEPAKGAPAALTSMMNAAAVPEGCRFCGGTLPDGRMVVYCPHCGNNLSVSRCPACGSELEKGWKFCATCGRTVG